MAGDSAGGGLAVALQVAARDAGEALPAAAVLMSPTVDLTSSGDSPLFASLTGLPPLLIQAGTADLLLSDAERLAAAAAGAGVDVTLETGAGLPHVYQILLGTPEAAAATGRIGKFLRARVGDAPRSPTSGTAPQSVPSSYE